VYYLLGEQFDSDPFLLFRLRGKSKTEIIAMLHARRSVSETESEPAEKPTRKPHVPAEPVVPLEKCLDRFWDTAGNLEVFAIKIEAPAVDAVPVKRLGAPVFWRDNKVDFIALFVRAYKGLTEASLSTAMGSRDEHK
jgi:uncharacterized Zn finger protein